jgi:Bacterial capsule synthesis protein PGA_cap
MKRNWARWLAAIIAASVGSISAGAHGLPIYIEDNHAGTFYWLAQQIDPDQPCKLIHFDAHSDASAIFDSDRLRSALRNVASGNQRQQLLDRMRQSAAVQCFNWIEPLMPAPIAKVVWVPGEKLTASERQERATRATALLDGHLEAAPRNSGSFRDRYLVSGFDHLAANLEDATPLIVTIDLDYFAGFSTSEKPAAFARIWDFVTQRPNLRAVTFAISRPYLSNDAEADQLVELALEAAFSLPTAEIEFEPFLSVGNDHSARAQEFRKAGSDLPAYDLSHSSESLRATILAGKNRINVQYDRARWEKLLGNWENDAPHLSLVIKNAQPSTDEVWRVPADQPVEIELVAEPCVVRPSEVEWSALVPEYARCNVTHLTSDQVGFVADAAPRPVWKEIRLPDFGPTLSIAKLDRYFEPRSHCGALRLRARTKIDGRIRQTPVIELRRFLGSGFRAAITEQFGLPYLFGSGELADAGNSGPEINLGADCANFVIFALRRAGQRIPWSDPKGLRTHLYQAASSVRPGDAHFTPNDLERGMIIDLETHVAALMEDRPPLGILDENDLVAHQLKGRPETLSLGDLLRDRRKQAFDLLQPPAATSETLLFGGDLMLGRSCAKKIENGVDPFAGIRTLLSRSSFVAANLECTISDLNSSAGHARYAFRAPVPSAKSLAAAGFRAVSLANNHALDYGAEALHDCAANLSREKIETAGFGSTIDQAYAAKIFSLPGARKVALLAIDDLGSNGSPGAQLASASDQARLQEAIESARQDADLIVCLVHWGIENTWIVSERQRELARWLIHHGVDAIVGSHPHCLQPLDFYHGCPIAYSLGNLVFDGAPTVASWNHGALLELGLSETGEVFSVRTIPIALQDGLPGLSPDEERAPGSHEHSPLGVALNPRP